MFHLSLLLPYLILHWFIPTRISPRHALDRIFPRATMCRNSQAHHTFTQATHSSLLVIVILVVLILLV